MLSSVLLPFFPLFPMCRACISLLHVPSNEEALWRQVEVIIMCRCRRICLFIYFFSIEENFPTAKWVQPPNGDNLGWQTVKWCTPPLHDCIILWPTRQRIQRNEYKLKQNNIVSSSDGNRITHILQIRGEIELKTCQYFSHSSGHF